MKHFLIALQFLTILPIKIKTKVTERDLGKSLVYFPVAGGVIGIFLACVSLIFGFLSRDISIVMVLFLSAILTGALHLDGFGDVCDGFFGGRSKENVLGIMRDSRIGAFGVTGLVNLFLLKFVLLLSIPQKTLPVVLIVMVIFARWVQVFACYKFDYVRPQGKAKGFAKGINRKGMMIATCFLLIVGLGLGGIRMPVILVLASLPVAFFMYYVKKRIGGMTGDTIGGASEIAELSFLLSLVIYVRLQCIY
ncbi:MAG: adenosylcobinamide-GDP ribazoletransferase [Candidatus Omnitrophica bacterium]|nr:adenosylcobinamide-GDP ribazoletransferase [Candidatus Omnitrophota bacterium]